MAVPVSSNQSCLERYLEDRLAVFHTHDRQKTVLGFRNSQTRFKLAVRWYLSVPYEASKFQHVQPLCSKADHEI